MKFGPNQLILFGSLLWGFSVSVCLAQDQVTYRADPTKPMQVRTGSITDYTSKVLTLRIGKQPRRIPTTQIQSVKTRRTSAHLRGGEQFRQGNLKEAIRFYDEALKREPRNWMKREVTADLIAALRENGNWIRAATTFSELLSRESDTRFFHVIPCCWTPLVPNAGRDEQASKWLNGDKEELSLVACSLLLSTTQRSSALQQLQKLRQSKDRRIAQLANMQIWRTRILTASTSEWESWQQKIEKYQPALRYGGYFVMAKARANNRQFQTVSRSLVAAELLRIPVLFPEQQHLAASALHAAAELIKKSNPQAATKILRELATKYSQTRLGREAAASWKQQKK